MKSPKNAKRPNRVHEMRSEKVATSNEKSILRAL
jgi:hypothetical protein